MLVACTTSHHITSHHTIPYHTILFRCLLLVRLQDIFTIAASVIMFGSTVGGMQVLGYAVALVGYA